MGDNVKPHQVDFVKEILEPVLAHLELRAQTQVPTNTISNHADLLNFLDEAVAALTTFRETLEEAPLESYQAELDLVVGELAGLLDMSLSAVQQELDAQGELAGLLDMSLSAVQQEPDAQHEKGVARAPDLAAIHRVLTDDEFLHRSGETYRAGNRYAGPVASLLDEHFFERLEQAGEVQLSPWTRGMIKGLILIYWSIREDRSQTKKLQSAWPSVTKQAGLLADSIKSSGALEDENWCRMNLGGFPPDILLGQLTAIASSRPPLSLPQDAPPEGQEPANQTNLTDASIGFGYVIVKSALTRISVFNEAWDAEEKRQSDANDAGLEGTLKIRRRGAEETDYLLILLAEAYDQAGGNVAVSWANPQKSKVGGPFARFLYVVWEALPPASRPRTQETFARRAKEILPKLRDYCRRGDGGVQ
jgi:hypothetical protein